MNLREYYQSTYWRSNDEWWTIRDDRYVLTEKAPAQARTSFAIFKGINPNSGDFSYYLPRVNGELPEKHDE